MPNVTINASVREEQHAALRQLASTGFEGSLSRTVQHIIDVHVGKETERALQRKELQNGHDLAAPVAVTRWKKPALSVELIAYIAGLVRAGNMIEIACNLAGVTVHQRSAWMKKGRNDRREGRQSLAADFVAALERAEAECEAEDIQRLRKHGNQAWTALAWRLERQQPDRYAQRKRMDTRVQHSLMPMVDYDKLTASETRTLVHLLRKASPESDDPDVGRYARPASELIPDDVADAVDGEWTDVEVVDVLELEAGGELAGADLPEAPALEKPQP